jgi:hypothetical protein
MTSTYTHRGWFALCPVYIGNTYTPAPTLVPRRRVLTPLFALSECIQAASIAVLARVDPEYDPNFAIVITGELDPPLEEEGLPWW